MGIVIAFPASPMHRKEICIVKLMKGGNASVVDTYRPPEPVRIPAAARRLRACFPLAVSSAITFQPDP